MLNFNFKHEVWMRKSVRKVLQSFPSLPAFQYALTLGSSDSSILVWELTEGRLLSVLSTYIPVLEVAASFDAGHILLRLKETGYVPLLCLHNSPAADMKDLTPPKIQRQTSMDVIPIRKLLYLIQFYNRSLNLSKGLR